MGFEPRALDHTNTPGRRETEGCLGRRMPETTDEEGLLLGPQDLALGSADFRGARHGPGGFVEGQPQAPSQPQRVLVR